MTGGLVVDGTGETSRSADVGVSGDRIAAIGDLSRAAAALTLDAAGMVVAPGFIDIHSHSDFTLLVDPRAQSQIYQGVTTELVGNCGHGCGPFVGDIDRFKGNIYGYQDLLDIDWRSLGEYLERLDEIRPAVNVATLVPNGNLRLAAVADVSRPATNPEIREMTKLLEEGLDAGAFGLSTGLEYPPEHHASEAEIVALCARVAARGGLYATHERERDVLAIEAVDEGIRAAMGSSVRLQLSHLIPRRGAPERALEQMIEPSEAAAADGVDVQFDAHTRLHGITNLSASLPQWALEGGPGDLAARLQDRAARERLKEYRSIIASFGLGGWDRVFLFASEGSPDAVGRSLADLTPPGADVFDTIYDLLLAEGDDPHPALVIVHSYEEDMLIETFKHPMCTTESDATALCVDGPLAGTTFLGAYTWASWFYRHMVRDGGHLSLEAAVHKLTAQPASRIGLTDRGALREGYRADITVFDPGRFAEQGSLDGPNRLAAGVQHVLVNGGPTIVSGGETGGRHGAVLRA